MLQLSLNFLGQQLDRLKPAHVSRNRIDRTVAWKYGIAVHIVFRPRARRYLLSLRPDGAARLVIPRRGDEGEGLRFLERSEEWLLKRVTQWHSKSDDRQPWTNGTRFLFRGEEVTLRVEDETRLCFADQIVPVRHAGLDYREAVKVHLRKIAERELPVRTRDLALLHGIAIRRVTIRAQTTRWGSCSAKGTISLNWRLIQAPAYVVDYLIIHELMHRREMNHSARYWNLVATACPDYHRAEQWLKSRQVELKA
jgi:hypothetical protein